MFYLINIIIVCTITIVYGQHDTHQLNDRSGIVHLFEWKFNDIANECERFLAPNGYAGVQVSPVNEYLVSQNRAWWERYQPISYKIISRSGNEVDFLDMSKRCNKVGIRIYVDVVFNHMAAPGINVYGTGGSKADPLARDFPAIPYNKSDFNPSCGINNYNNATEVRVCELVSLPDLNQTRINVRNSIGTFLNNLVDLGVAGFRVDACKHMWPKDLEAIFGSIKNLNTEFGFKENSRPFIYQEVIDLGTEKISKFEYIDYGAVTEFSASLELGNIFRGSNPLNTLVNWGPAMGFLSSRDAFIFVDNHDNQRGHGAGGDTILTYKLPKQYIMAEAFLLAHPFGIPRIMSSYDFSDTDQGPPSDNDQNILSPTFNEDESCGNGWICEHRWRQIANMIKFRNAVSKTEVTAWTSIGENQISFCRGEKGFIAFNNDNTKDLKTNINVCVPPGTYCDIISGNLIDSKCTGISILVYPNRTANILLEAQGVEGVLAFHIGSKLN